MRVMKFRAALCLLISAINGLHALAQQATPIQQSILAQDAPARVPSSPLDPAIGNPAEAAPATLANDWRVVSARPKGEAVVIRLRDGNSLKGNFKSASDDGIVLEMKNKELSLGREEIVSVAVLSRRSARRSTVLGLALGGGIGAGAGAGIAAAAFGSRSGFCCPRGQSAAVGAAVGGTVGALVGCLTGFVRGRSGHKEIVIYRSVPSK